MNSKNRIFPALITFALLFSVSKAFPTPPLPAPSAESTRYLALADSADMMMAKEEWGKAEVILEKMLREEPANPTNPMVISNLANVKFMLEKYGEAASLADVALARAENSVTLRNLKAKALIADNRPEEGEAELELSLKCDSLQTWPNLAIGIMAMRKGNTERAKEYLGRAYRLQPDDPENALPYAEICTVTNNTDEAIRIYESFPVESLGADAIFRYIQLLLHTGNTEKGNHISRQALELYPTDGNLYVLRAVFFNLNHQNSDVEVALKLAKKYNAEHQVIEFYFPKKRK